MKLICVTLLVLFTISSCKSLDYMNLVQDISNQEINPELVDFVKGFLQGVGTATNFEDLRACLVDTQEIYTDIDTGVQDILTRKIDRVKQGIALLGKAAQVVPNAAQLCKAADADIEKLIDAVETFKNPVEFIYYVGKSLIINRVEVFKEVEGALDAYQSQNYTGLGYWVGKAMDTILLNQKVVESPRDSKTDLLEFAKGFLQGISNASVFDNLKACIADSENVYKDISNGIADIETRVPDQVKQGIALLGQAAQIVPDAAQLCKVSTLDMDRLIQLLESFKSPQSFLYYIGKSLVINHVEVIHEVESAVSAYKGHDYTHLGYWVGKAMDTILLGQTSETIAVQDTNTDVLYLTRGFLEENQSRSRSFRLW